MRHELLVSCMSVERYMTHNSPVLPRPLRFMCHLTFVSHSTCGPWHVTVLCGTLNTSTRPPVSCMSADRTNRARLSVNCHARVYLSVPPCLRGMHSICVHLWRCLRSLCIRLVRTASYDRAPLAVSTHCSGWRHACRRQLSPMAQQTTLQETQRRQLTCPAQLWR